MTESIAFIPYKEIKKKKSREYYPANKEAIGEKNKIIYSKFSLEQKKMRKNIISVGMTSYLLKEKKS